MKQVSIIIAVLCIVAVISYVASIGKNHTPAITEIAATSTDELLGLGELKAIDCPNGAEAFLKSQKIDSQKQIECGTSEAPLVVNGSVVKDISIIYGSYVYEGDMVLPLVATALQLPSGELIPDEKLSMLPVKFNYYAGAEVGKLYDLPFPHDPRLWGTRRGNPYVRLKGKIMGPNASGNYCGTYVAVAPAQGEVVVCGKGDDEKPEVTGSVRLSDGVFPYDDAAKLGKPVADKAYSDMGVQSNYLKTYVNRKEYRFDLQAWVLSYYLDHMQLVSVDVPPFYHTHVIVKVDKNGAPCLVGSYRAGQEKPDFGTHECLPDKGVSAAVPTQEAEFIFIKQNIGRLTNTGAGRYEDWETTSLVVETPKAKLLTHEIIRDENGRALEPIRQAISLGGRKIGEIETHTVGIPYYSPNQQFAIFKAELNCFNPCAIDRHRIYVADLENGSFAEISKPRSSGDFKGDRSKFQSLSPYVESYEWKDGGKLEMTTFYLGFISNNNQFGYYQVSPKELWSYDMATKKYSFIKELEY